MGIKHYRRGVFILLILAVFFAALVSCGSGGGSSNGAATTGSQTGSVAILITDSPSDDFSEINVTITKIILLCDDRKATVFSGSRKYNLLNLRNEQSLLIGNNVPAGCYCKIRLIVSDVELIDKEGKPVVDKPVKLPGNGKIDLNPRKPFCVAPGEMLTLQLDLDADKCIKLDENNNKYVFRPVIFIDIIDGIPPSQDKFLRVTGIVREKESDRFRLCGVNHYDSYSMVSSDDYDDEYDNECIYVYVSDDTAFFSDMANGRPVSYDDVNLDETVSAVGFLRMMSSESDDDHDDLRRMMSMDAIVIEIGTFLSLDGMIRSGVDEETGQFDFEISPGQGYAETPLIKVNVQEDSDGKKGTKIYSSNGEALDAAAIDANVDKHAKIDGILFLEQTILNAAFIVIDTPSRMPSDELSGQIFNITCDMGNAGFDIRSSDGSIDCVKLADNAEILLIEGDNERSRPIECEDLIRGQQVDLYGAFDTGSSGCFIADTVIAFEIRR